MSSHAGFVQTFQHRSFCIFQLSLHSLESFLVDDENVRHFVSQQLAAVADIDCRFCTTSSMQTLLPTRKSVHIGISNNCMRHAIHLTSPPFQQTSSELWRLTTVWRIRGKNIRTEWAVLTGVLRSADLDLQYRVSCLCVLLTYRVRQKK